MNARNVMLVHASDGGRIWLDMAQVDCVRIPERLGDGAVVLRSGYFFAMPRETAQKLIDLLGEGAKQEWR